MCRGLKHLRLLCPFNDFPHVLQNQASWRRGILVTNFEELATVRTPNINYQHRIAPAFKPLDDFLPKREPVQPVDAIGMRAFEPGLEIRHRHWVLPIPLEAMLLGAKRHLKGAVVGIGWVLVMGLREILGQHVQSTCNNVVAISCEK